MCLEHVLDMKIYCHDATICSGEGQYRSIQLAFQSTCKKKTMVPDAVFPLKSGAPLRKVGKHHVNIIMVYGTL